MKLTPGIFVIWKEKDFQDFEILVWLFVFTWYEQIEMKQYQLLHWYMWVFPLQMVSQVYHRISHPCKVLEALMMWLEMAFVEVFLKCY